MDTPKNQPKIVRIPGAPRTPTLTLEQLWEVRGRIKGVVAVVAWDDDSLQVVASDVTLGLFASASFAMQHELYHLQVEHCGDEGEASELPTG